MLFTVGQWVGLGTQYISNLLKIACIGPLLCMIAESNALSLEHWNKTTNHTCVNSKVKVSMIFNDFSFLIIMYCKHKSYSLVVQTIYYTTCLKTDELWAIQRDNSMYREWFMAEQETWQIQLLAGHQATWQHHLSSCPANIVSTVLLIHQPAALTSKHSLSKTQAYSKYSSIVQSGLMSHLTHYRSFWGRYNQPITWLLQKTWSS